MRKKEIFDFEFIQDTHVNGIKKKNVVAFAGDKKQVLFLKQLFSAAGCPLSGITAPPFALRNFICTNMVRVGPVPMIIVNVSRNYSEITCLSDKSILLTRNIRTGSYSLVEELLDHTGKESKNLDIPALLSSDMEKNSSEFNSIEPAASRLLGKIIRTGDYCSQNFAGNEPVSKFLFFGEIDDCRAFMEYAAEQLSDKTGKFTPYEDQSAGLTSKISWPRGPGFRLPLKGALFALPPQGARMVVPNLNYLLNKSRSSDTFSFFSWNFTYFRIISASSPTVSTQ